MTGRQGGGRTQGTDPLEQDAAGDPPLGQVADQLALEIERRIRRVGRS